ncbi:DUF6270 domain-containing protein [Arthrobacter sp. NtRootA1]|uniref:DUF6270 domain-containing protein n=1 Tax=Arthrobacter sp. NtRootA1 TaxID=2830983 RepID=UPI001CC34CB2|nr:DUF6270 domain-containing protein [Arthrobacter sp. NtRootA1]BCW07723.1 hypothetical protein NtRootA1_38610 [Arthrobacter sp. NtRootA1]
MPSVFIYGSCVSRDPFEKPNEFELKGYFARSSLGSAFRQPPTADTPLPNMDALASRFQQRMVQSDIHKNLAESLTTTEYDWLVVDFIDERMNTIELGGTTITQSDELKTIEFAVDPATVHEPWSETGWSNRVEGLHTLVRLVDPSKIIVNRVYWATIDTSGQPFGRSRWFDRNNRLLYDLYKEIEKSPGIRFIDYPGGAPLAADKHGWGRQPFHYSEVSNDHFLSELSRLTKV